MALYTRFSQVILLFLVLLLTSCMSVEKATSYLQSKGKLSEVCAEKFPVNETFIQGETTVVIDSIFVAGDSVQCEPSPVPKKVKCPDSKVEVKHSFRVDTLVQENTAKVDMYKQKYHEEIAAKEVALKEKEQEREGKKQWRNLALFSWLVIIVYVGIKIYL